MLNSSLAALAALVIASAAPAIAQNADTAQNTQVMILGTYHFDGGGADLHSADVEDSRGAEAQRQIADVLDRIETFQPTRIMVELTPEHESDFNAAYRAFLEGERELGNNERQQLGMALAARLGHERLYAVDFQNGMDFNAMLESAQANQQARVLAQFEDFNTGVADLMGRLETGTVRERLILSNGPDVDRLHDGYFILAQAGSPADPVGAREMGAWWERNLIIFSNIAFHTEPGDRVLVIYGSGHKHLLDRFFDRAPGFELIDPLDYLQ
ncbi:MAG: DUF5694 domain-containing protein [Oceanicaulis sp.]